MNFLYHPTERINKGFLKTEKHIFFFVRAFEEVDTSLDVFFLRGHLSAERNRMRRGKMEVISFMCFNGLVGRNVHSKYRQEVR